MLSNCVAGEDSWEFLGLQGDQGDWLPVNPKRNQPWIFIVRTGAEAEAPILWHSVFMMIPTLTSVRDYWKNHSFDFMDLCHKVMFLLFNTLSRFVIAFLLRSKWLLISRLQSLSAVILEFKKIKYHCFHFSPFYLPWSDGTGCHDLSFLNVEF